MATSWLTCNYPLLLYEQCFFLLHDWFVYAAAFRPLFCESPPGACARREDPIGRRLVFPSSPSRVLFGRDGGVESCRAIPRWEKCGACRVTNGSIRVEPWFPFAGIRRRPTGVRLQSLGGQFHIVTRSVRPELAARGLSLGKTMDCAQAKTRMQVGMPSVHVALGY